MKKLEKANPFFKFYVGDENFQSPSRIVYLEDAKFKEDLDKMSDFIYDNRKVTIAEIANHLNLDIETYVGYINNLIDQLVKEYPKVFHRLDENRVYYYISNS